MFGIRFLIKSTILLGILGAVLIVLINIFDERLKPEAEEFTRYIDRAIPEDSNGYYYLMGMPNRETSDPYQTGRKLVADSRLFSERAKPGDKPDFSELEAAVLGSNRYEVSKGIASLCDPGKRECLDVYGRARYKIRTLLAENSVIYARAEKLRSYQHFTQYRTADIGFPIEGYSLALQKLYLASVGIDTMSGRLSHALHRLEIDARFWRTALLESNQLIGKW